MSGYMVLERLMEASHGYLMASQAVENGVSRTVLSQYVKDKGLERVARGIYIADDVWTDELFVLQVRNENIVYCGETALYLHGLIDREYSKICISVPRGVNVAHIKISNLHVKYPSRELHLLGVCQVTSISGNDVRAYDKERCICDLIKNRSKTEVQDFQIAIKEYMSGRDKNLSRLVEYAKILGIRDEVMKYLEVLL